MSADKIEETPDVFVTWFAHLQGKEFLPMFKMGPDDSAFSNIRVGRQLMTCIAGRTGRGKSALVMQGLYQMLHIDPSLSAVVLNYEMPFDMVLNRLLSFRSGLPAAEIDKGNYDFDDDNFARAVDDVMKLKNRIHFVGQPFTIENVKRVVERYGADIVVLDYLQKIKPERDYHDPRQNVNAVLDGARDIAAANKAVIIVSEVTTGNSDDDRSLGLHNLKESHEIGNNCDNVYIMRRLRLLPGDVDVVRLTNDKSKYSPRVDVQLYFDKALVSFSEEEPCPTSAA